MEPPFLDEFGNQVHVAFTEELLSKLEPENNDVNIKIEEEKEDLQFKKNSKARGAPKKEPRSRSIVEKRTRNTAEKSMKAEISYNLSFI